MSNDINKLISEINPNTKVISDLHLGDRNILKYEPVRSITLKYSPYLDIDDMIINLWNDSVSVDETVICLGDFSKPSSFEKINKLNGNIIWVLGNHDPSTDNLPSFKNVYPVKGLNLSDPSLSPVVINNRSSCLSIPLNDTNLIFTHHPISEDRYIKKDSHYHKNISFLRKYLHKKKYINIHGHTHSRHTLCDKEVNASIEVLPKFKPISISELLGMHWQKKR